MELEKRKRNQNNMLKKIKIAWHRMWKNWHEKEEGVFFLAYSAHAKKATRHWHALDKLGAT